VVDFGVHLKEDGRGSSSSDLCCERDILLKRDRAHSNGAFGVHSSRWSTVCTTDGSGREIQHER
jgi:hypothetical protein